LFLLHLFAVSPGSPQESQTPQAGSIVAGVAKVSTTATGEPPPIPDPIPVPDFADQKLRRRWMGGGDKKGVFAGQGEGSAKIQRPHKL